MTLTKDQRKPCLAVRRRSGSALSFRGPWGIVISACHGRGCLDEFDKDPAWVEFVVFVGILNLAVGELTSGRKTELWLIRDLNVGGLRRRLKIWSEI